MRNAFRLHSHMSDTVLVLYSELMPDRVAVFRKLAQIYNLTVHVVCWDGRKKNTPFEAQPSEQLVIHRRSEFDVDALHRLAARLSPKILYVAGWMDRGYLPIAAALRRKGIPVIVGFDDLWFGTVRQRVGALLSPLLTKVLFSHAWVSGPRQYEYAKRLGFADRRIIPNLLSCDTEMFAHAFKAMAQKRSNYPRAILYVGRFSSEKGIAVLVDGYRRYRAQGGDWTLRCIGSGPLRSLLEGVDGLELHSFAAQADLVHWMADSGVAVVPSVRDASPLVVHEAACAGLPMVLSSSIGNLPLFMIDGYNGVVFPQSSAPALAEAMRAITSRSVDELVAMGERSHLLSQRVNLEMAAAGFMASLSQGYE